MYINRYNSGAKCSSDAALLSGAAAVGTGFISATANGLNKNADNIETNVREMICCGTIVVPLW